METPIFDFVQKYSRENHIRLHMPGHKGENILGCEALDITEIFGADDLYLSEKNGIIGRSEANASEIFGSSATFYSTGGSSQCIGAMLYLAKLAHGSPDGNDVILAGRNAHKTFVLRCALLGIEPEWLYPSDDNPQNICACKITADALHKKLQSMDKLPIAVFICSPDYLGNIADIKELSTVCQKFNIPLLIDNAHGAYLKFLHPSAHPIDLGASMCCDSAHKTLSALTGGAYLHIAKNPNTIYVENAKNALAFFGSTSPSYLILQSLDLCNKILSDDYEAKLADFIKKVDELKSVLNSNEIIFTETEPLKLVIDCKSMGISSDEVAEKLRLKKIEPEFSDGDFLVFMLTMYISDLEIKTLKDALIEIFSDRNSFKIRENVSIPIQKSVKKMSVRTALFSPQEVIDLEFSLGRISASPTVSCPPAIPIVVSGELIEQRHLELFRYYGIETVSVVKKASTKN